jgi:hypothetical protein
MRPTLASQQESVLEELMQSSFGAQYLYTPERYKKGSGNDEPCDLLWFSNGVLVLFYMTSGKKSIEKQDEHNLKQAHKWNKYWSSCPKTIVRGKNRYGDNLALQRNEVRLLASISVISHDVGIVFHPQKRNNSIDGFTCTIPEKLIHFISQFHGTVIDLLQILLQYSNNLLRHITRHSKLGPDRLRSIIEKHTNTTILPLRQENPDLKIKKEDFEFVYKILDTNRLPAHIGEKLALNQSVREHIGQYFCDLSARDYIVLAKCALAAISKTDGGRLSISAMTQGLFLDWVVFATTFRANNMIQLFNDLQESLERMEKKDLPLIIYAYDFEGAEYRSPSMYCMQPKRKSSQAETLMRATMQNIYKRHQIIVPV